MRSVGYRSALTTRQVRRRRSLFQQRVEHGVWSTRDGEHLVEDHDWGRGRLHAFCPDAFAAGRNGFPFGFAIDCAGGDSYAGAGSISRSDHNSGGFACWFGRRCAIESAEVSLEIAD